MSATRHQSADCERNLERGKENEGRVFGGRVLKCKTGSNVYENILERL